MDVLSAFKNDVESLRDFPDGNIIGHLTNLARENVNFAQPMADIIMSRLISANSLYKRPLFYAIDSILKRVGGPFQNIFMKYFYESYQRILYNIPAMDGDKLNFLFNTWQERNFLPVELISNMRNELIRLKANPNQLHQMANANHQRPIAPQEMQQVHNRNTGLNAPSVLQQPQLQHTTFNNEVFRDIVANEMVVILHQMYKDMNITNQLTLEQIAIENPNLFSQIRAQAEVAAHNFLSRGNKQSAVLAASSVPPRPIVSHAPYAGHFPQPSHPPVQNSPSVQFSSTHQQPVSQMHQRQPPQPHSFVPPPPPPRIAQAYSNPPDASGRKRSALEMMNLPHQAAAPIASNVIAPAHLPLAIPAPILTVPQDQNHPPVMSITNQAPMDSLQRGKFVNGFICETPVVIDIDRVRNLAEKSFNDVENNGVDPRVPAVYGQISDRIRQRLQIYLQNVMIPPPLPGVLQASTNLLHPIAQTADMNAIKKSGSKLTVPEFTNQDLLKNPEAMLRKFFVDRPHQYFEDGLRFRTLAELQKHSDEFLEKKKLLSKNKSVKEVRIFREWFCNVDQWISEFNSLNVVNDIEISKTSSAGNLQAEAEEFIIPEDERFARCPISKEVFERVWDDEEGEMMYRNAVKVLLLESTADPSLFRLASPTISGVENIRYMIVHKPLVMDPWLKDRKAGTLRETLDHMSSQGTEGKSLANRLEDAAGDEQDDVDIFVLW